jgi:hypothetical protein
MNKYFKIAVLGAAAAATLLTSFEFASARDRYPYWRNNHHGHYHNGRWVAAGVLGGLAAGVIVGSALAEPEVVYERPRRVVVEEGPVYAEPEYLGPVDEYDGQPDERYSNRDDQNIDDEQMNDQARQDYYPDRPQHRQARQQDDYAARGTIEPWTAEWRAYCSQRYQSFNARTGTYRGYDSQDHFCTAG